VKRRDKSLGGAEVQSISGLACKHVGRGKEEGAKSGTNSVRLPALAFRDLTAGSLFSIEGKGRGGTESSAHLNRLGERTGKGTKHAPSVDCELS